MSQSDKRNEHWTEKGKPGKGCFRCGTFVADDLDGVFRHYDPKIGTVGCPACTQALDDMGKTK